MFSGLQTYMIVQLSIDLLVSISPIYDFVFMIDSLIILKI